MKNYLNNFEEEEICGFLVPEKLKKIQNIEIDLFEQFKKVCKKLNIHYFAQSGTLLGAIRHRGFIPWDDDMDFGLLRKDYNKFMKYGPKLFKYPYFFQSSNTDRNYDLPCIRIRNSETTGFITLYAKKPFHQGIFIDIQCFDIEPNKKRIEKASKILNFLKLVRALKRKDTEIKKENISRKTIFCSNLIKWLPYSYLCRLSDKVAARYFRSKEKDPTLSVLTKNTNWTKYKFHLSELKDLIEVPFEKTQMSIPRKYQYHLESSYGDWSKIPEKDKIGKWHEGIVLFDPNLPYTQFNYKN